MSEIIKNKASYFLWCHGILLLVVLIGFAPSFYLRPLGIGKSLPAHMIIHGIVCTAWFLGIFLQSYFIQSSRLAIHKKAGRYLALLAPLITLTGLWLMGYRIENYYLGTSEFALANPDRPEFEAMLIWGDILVLFSFVVLVYMGYKTRMKSDFHKRYMLFASIMIVPQAFIRLGKLPWLQIGSDPGASGSLYAVAGPVLMLLSLVVYDRLRLKQVHKATKVSWLWYVLLLVSAAVIMRTGIGAFVLEGIKWVK